ncbi:MAG: ATP-binding protein [Rhodospirillales bacterium]|nr:ATP-binding protein [Rhodospirillales bacterium]
MLFSWITTRASSPSSRSRTNSRVQAARMVTAEALPLAEERALNIEVALHEALANAMIHGNLEIPDISRETPGDLISSARAIDEALADEKLGSRLVVIAASWQEGRLVISVIDQGIGYAADANRKPEVEGKNGRGLWIINLLAESVAVTDGGRRLTMRFGP